MVVGVNYRMKITSNCEAKGSYFKICNNIGNTVLTPKRFGTKQEVYFVTERAVLY